MKDQFQEYEKRVRAMDRSPGREGLPGVRLFIVLVALMVLLQGCTFLAVLYLLIRLTLAK